MLRRTVIYTQRDHNTQRDACRQCSQLQRLTRHLCRGPRHPCSRPLRTPRRGRKDWPSPPKQSRTPMAEACAVHALPPRWQQQTLVHRGTHPRHRPRRRRGRQPPLRGSSARGGGKVGGATSALCTRTSDLAVQSLHVGAGPTAAATKIGNDATEERTGWRKGAPTSREHAHFRTHPQSSCRPRASCLRERRAKARRERLSVMS